MASQGREVRGDFVTGLIVGALISGAIVWWIAAEGPNSGMKELPEACAALEDEYWAAIEHMLSVSPLVVQLHNAGAFDSRFVEVVEGDPPGVMYADNDAIEATWQPGYESVTDRFQDASLACQSEFS